MHAYPLSWPDGWPRTRPQARRVANFERRERLYRNGSYTHSIGRNLTVSEGVDRVLLELRRMEIARDDVIVSTNVRTRLDGMPRSGEREPDDPGAAVYWQDGPGLARRVMAIDLYCTVADNLAAIAATLAAMRSIERHGGAVILDRAFAGFAALPAPASVRPRGWRDVLGFSAGEQVTAETIVAAYRRRAAECHPDRGGSDGAMADLNAARADAMRDIEAGA